MKLMTLTNAFFVFCGAMLIVHPAVADVHNGPLPAGYRERAQAYASLCQDAKLDMQARNYIRAEEEFRGAIAADADSGAAYLGLAEALEAQGKTIEALQAYHGYFNPGPTVSWLGGSAMPKAYLEYALLLNQNGQWAEAAAHYNDVLPQLVDLGLKNPVQLDPNTPQPLALTVGAHIGLGLYDNFRDYEPDSNTKAFAEYTTALGLAPNWDAANYYYGVGWSRLDLKSQTRAVHAAQAKAALKKAAASDDAVVKKAASETLEGLK